MEKLVIMPGGFHPFHAGHLALYNAASQQWPDSEVYVAATNDTSNRPFPFAIKEKLAKLAGIPAGHFVQVASPFQANEITAGHDPNDTEVIFVRSIKDKDKPPQGLPLNPDKDEIPLVTKGPNKGKPAKLLNYDINVGNIKPMNQHVYLAYLPVKPFGNDNLTSATEIRTKWLVSDSDGKADLVNQIYPKTNGNEKLTDVVIKMLDAGMGVGNIKEPKVTETVVVNDPEQGVLIRPDGGLGSWNERDLVSSLISQFSEILQMLKGKSYTNVEYVLYKAGAMQAKVKALSDLQQFQEKQGRRPIAKGREVQLETPTNNIDYAVENNTKI